MAKYFHHTYTFKFGLLVFLIILLQIPASMIRGLVYERGNTAKEAEANIMEAWGKQLSAAGPIIVIPGVRTTEARVKTEKEGEKVEIKHTPITLAIAPQKLGISADFKTEVRKRGIFAVPLFYGEMTLTGNFAPAMALAALEPNERLFFNQAALVISLSGQKGIRKINTARFNYQELFFQPGSLNNKLFRRGSSGIYAKIPNFTNQKADFAISIAIQGGQLMEILPIGQDNHIDITADWRSPSFQGSFLPNKSHITDKGFTAQWDISYLSRNIPLFWREGYTAVFDDSLFGVNFLRVLDTYAINTRAVKYAVLFLAAPFFTLFLLEIFAKKHIHPVSYVLAGIENIIFYLLLLSLSEQINFFAAYFASALAVTITLTLYVRSLLPDWRKNWYMGIVVAIMYIFLYAVLNAESYALLIGSISAFIVVALVMYLTRRFNWEELENIWPKPKPRRW
ncbi:MAG: cell envelope integrity protein CreD [Candidatus Margulisbacteria bacterium]|jgi:inner membrane protein|nr:cell envelope integrity protein CreD [Candidatus Margulisiibacteriota bacterium]